METWKKGDGRIPEVQAEAAGPVARFFRISIDKKSFQK